MEMTFLLTTAIVAGILAALLQRKREELRKVREELKSAYREWEEAEEKLRQVEQANVRLEKAADSYRSEVEPLKALADGLGKQLAAMGRKK